MVNKVCSFSDHTSRAIETEFAIRAAALIASVLSTEGFAVRIWQDGDHFPITITKGRMQSRLCYHRQMLRAVFGPEVALRSVVDLLRADHAATWRAEMKGA